MVGPSLAQAAAELSAIPDAGVREAAACELLPDALLEMPEDFLSDAIDMIADAPGGPELLPGLAVAAPTPIAVRARARLAEMDRPPAGLGPLRVERAWGMDADEPVSGLYLLGSREGARGKQLFAFVLETLVSGGAIKDGFVTGTSEGTRTMKKLTGEVPEDVEVREIDPVEACERVVAAAARGARSGLAPSAEGLVALSVFLRASGVEDADAVVLELELGESLAERVEELDEEARSAAVNALADEARGWFLGTGAGRGRAEAGAFAAGLMGEFRAFYLDAGLYDWKPGELDELLLDWVPRKVSLDEEEIATFPESVADVFRFLADTGRLDDAAAGNLAERARSLRAEFVEAMADPALAGTSKLLFDAMRAEGVEVGDPQAMQDWLEDFNARPFEERGRILGPALPPPLEAAPKRPAKAKKRKAQRQARRRNRKG